MFLHKKSYVVISLITVLQKCLIFTQDQEMQVNGGCLNSGYTVWKIEKEQLVSYLVHLEQNIQLFLQL